MKASVRYIRAALVTIAVLLIGCGDEQTASTEQATDSVVRPDTEAFGARIQLYEGSRVTTRIDADKIVKFAAKDSTVAYRLDIDVFDTAGVHSTDIVGDSGIIREQTGNMSLYGNVVVVTADSIKLETEFLFWDAKVDSIKTDAFVRLTRGEDVITGYGLQADQRLHSTKILRHVSGTITDPKKLEER
ncbi:MAG: LPS export ABC transporter periplasmic protein LptC [Candidatus Zixiibacteriota bacterium]